MRGGGGKKEGEEVQEDLRGGLGKAKRERERIELTNEEREWKCNLGL